MKARNIGIIVANALILKSHAGASLQTCTPYPRVSDARFTTIQKNMPIKLRARAVDANLAYLLVLKA
jgi:hypothetical protein